MKVLTKYFLALFMVSSLLGCGDDDGPESINADQASTKALQMVSGQVTSTELDNTGSQPEWEVDVTTDAGAEIEIEFNQLTGELVQIEGNQGPFSYEVNPGLGLIVFSEAKQTAMNEAEVGELSGWELEKDETGKWIYEFIVINDGVEREIEIDAATGLVID